MTTPVHPLISPWGRFGLYTFLIDAPQLAIVDTGIASSPTEGMAPELAKLGRRIEDVEWILLTHGHIDHMGGAYALWEMTGRKAKVVLHEADVPFLTSRRAHVDNYLGLRARYLDNPDAEAQQTAMAEKVISGEMQPTMIVRGGETIDLGGGVTVSVHHTPGHTEGSVAYVIDGQNDVFVGDAVQIHGAANGFPGYEDPDAYRSSLEYLRDVVAPNRMYQGHPYGNAAGEAYGVELDRDTAHRALQDSLDIEARVRAAVEKHGASESDSPYSPYEAIATDLGYAKDPTLEPSPFFTTVHGYRHLSAQA